MMKTVLLASTMLAGVFAGDPGTQVKTAVGRIVYGHPLKPQPKKQQDGPNKGQPVMKDGQPVMQINFGVAFPFADFESIIWPAMSAEATKGYPSGIPGRFAWKYKDSRGNDGNGKPYADRDGYAGCYVLNVSSELATHQVVKFDPATNGYRQLSAEEIKTGDYVVCVLNLKVNVAQGTNTPSLYVNPVLIEHVGYGQPIVSANAPDPMALLGGATYALPAGASAQPVAPVAGMAPPMTPAAPGMPPVAGTPPMMPGAPGAMPPAPGAMPPAAGTPPMMPGMAPTPPMAPPAPPAPPVAPPAGPQRPTDPSHIHMPGTPQEMWWINGAWTPAVVAPPAPTLPPPAPDFVANAGMPPAPGMPGVPPMPGR